MHKSFNGIVFFLLCATCLFCTISVFSQDKIIVKGKVSDEKGIAIEFASIAIFKDSILLKGDMTDSAGLFTILLDVGVYTLKTTAVGFNSTSLTINTTNKPFYDVVLRRSEVSLEEIKISATKNLIIRNVDRIAFDVASSIFNQGLSSIEILSLTPQLEESSSGGIKMFGKSGVKVMINGRLLNLKEEDINERLKAIRSESIQTVEVFTIPPSKYSAEGNVGFVNIILKKNDKEGFSGNVFLFELWNKAGVETNPSLNLNFSKGKFENTLSLSFDRTPMLNTKETMYLFKNSSKWIDSNYVKSISNLYTFSNTSNFKFSNKDQIGLLINYSFKSTNSNSYSRFDYKNPESKDSTIKSNINTRETPNNIALTFFYERMIDEKGKKMSITSNYYLEDSPVSSTTSSHTHKKVSDNIMWNLDNTSSFLNSVKSILVDLEMPQNKFRLDYGLSYTTIRNKSSLESKLDLGSGYFKDNGLSNRFDYQENTAGSYLNYSDSWGKKISMQMGLRFERTNYNFFSLIDNKNYSRTYNNLFPLLNIKLGTITFSYTRRIDRPSLSYLNPFRIYFNQNYYLSGNPSILPYLTDVLEFSYSHKNKFSLSLMNDYANGIVNYITEVKKDNSVVLLPVNIINQKNYNLRVTYRENILKKVRTQNNINFGYVESKPYTDIYDLQATKGFGASFLTTNTITLNKKKNSFLEVSYNHFFPRVFYLTKYDSYAKLNISYRFKLLKLFQCSIATSDLFKQNILNYETNYKEMVQKVRFNYYMHNFRFTINYNFGNSKVEEIFKESKLPEKNRFVR